MNVFSCLLSVQHSCMKDSESCYDECADVNVRWTGQSVVSSKEKAVK